MSHPHFELKDIRLDDIRSACAAIDETLSRSPENAELRTRWSELVALLALGPAHVLRACPNCKQLGMFAATRCGHCWTKLPVPTMNDAITAA